MLCHSDLPLTLEELFPAYVGAHGMKAPSRSTTRLITDGFVKFGAASYRKIDGTDMWERDDLGAVLKTMSPTVDQIEAVAAAFGMTEDEMRLKTANNKLATRRGKFNIAVDVMYRLVDANSPLPKNILFKPKRGVKLEERAAWTTGWHLPFLDALAARGYIRSVTGGSVLYEATNRDALRGLCSGDGPSDVCLHQILWPGEDCILNHVCDFTKVVDGVPLKPDGSFLESLQRLSSSKKAPEAAPVPKPVSPSPAPHVPAPAAVPTPEEMMASASAFRSSVLKRMDDLAKAVDINSNTSSLVLKSLRETIDVQSKLGSALMDLTDKLQAIEKSRSSAMTSLESRVSSMEKELKSSAATSGTAIESVRKGLSEVAQVIAGARTKDDEILASLSHLHQFVLSKAHIPDIGSRLDSAMADLSALNDMVLDALPPSRKS